VGVSQAPGSRKSLLNASGEWRTIAVIVAVYGLTILTVMRHEVLTPWLTIPFLSVLGAWHLSMQHETIHGHPFRRQWINDVIGSIPVTLWIPYFSFKKDHIEHHQSDLTHPGLDNESYYVSPEAWARAGKIRRAAYWANRTILFRMFVWTVVSTLTYLWSIIRQMLRGDKQAWFAMAVHAAGLLVVAYLVRSVAGMPLWQFAFGTLYGGRILNAIRPFPEHKYQDGTETRTAMVMAGPFMSLLMLNNNLHVAHHEQPGVAWYEVPKMSERVNAVERAREVGLLYEGGYAEVFRKFSFRPMGAPLRDGA
jgi:fatty acid desaturase